ncbi:MAG TPA: SpoIIE family protein phosphatase [Candidatus Saccharimonadales bacterium]|nr:SpoIIE family protein phosphatase [Candidatus Saccharimonadales bacterium]
MNGTQRPQTAFWRGLSALDWIALVLTALLLITSWFANAFRTVRGLGFFRFLGLLAIFYLFYRFWSRWKNEVLWSLRNRLIVAYLFIAIVPIVLILIFASLLGQIIYSQLGAYLLYHDFEDRMEMLADSSAGIAAVERSIPSNVDAFVLEKALAEQVLVAQDKELPGLMVSFGGDIDRFQKLAGEKSRSFTGLVQSGAQLRLASLRLVSSPRGDRVIELTVPVTPGFLDRVAPDLGPIDITLAETVQSNSGQSAVEISGKEYRRVGSVRTDSRVLPPPETSMDPIVDGFSQLKAVYLNGDRPPERDHPVFAFFTARRSMLNHRIFASLGELSGARISQLQVIGVVFLIIELVALWIGIRLTRAMTHTISNLSQATQSVQQGNFSARVPVERRDQLGMLGESFNSMTSSIDRLITEQKQLQRLENEISIAREVQDQLFPQSFPQVAGVEIEAICRAARSVSGDYYDFIQLSPTQVAIAIADISGKGISAALLMASLQAALRSQLLTPGCEQLTTAELVSRLNKHLVRNTGDDRFATFLLAIYDISTRNLRYTNAGHLPGFCIWDGKAKHLDVGGIVLGVMDDYHYQEGSVDVPRDAVLIEYSDGLVEPENAYGEEFGVSRLEAAAQRVRHTAPRTIAQTLMTAAEEWSSSPEQADDMTVIVAKLK